MLILDEVTSALDPETEAEICRNIAACAAAIPSSPSPIAPPGARSPTGSISSRRAAFTNLDFDPACRTWRDRLVPAWPCRSRDPRVSATARASTIFWQFRSRSTPATPIGSRRFSSSAANISTRARTPIFSMPRRSSSWPMKWKRPVGRISAQVDRLRLERYGDATGQFGFLEAPDDPEDFSRSLSGCRRMAAKHAGMQRVQGPFSFSINDETGPADRGLRSPARHHDGPCPPLLPDTLEALGLSQGQGCHRL